MSAVGLISARPVSSNALARLTLQAPLSGTYSVSAQTVASLDLEFRSLMAHLGVSSTNTAAISSPFDTEPSPFYVIIPLSSLPQLKADEVLGPFADVRRVYFALCEAFYQGYRSKPLSQRPNKMLITRSSGDFEGVIQRTYLFKFITDTSGEEINEEN